MRPMPPVRQRRSEAATIKVVHQRIRARHCYWTKQTVASTVPLESWRANQRLVHDFGGGGEGWAGNKDGSPGGPSFGLWFCWRRANNYWDGKSV